jgi:hypothetical protein
MESPIGPKFTRLQTDLTLDYIYRVDEMFCTGTIGTRHYTIGEGYVDCRSAGNRPLA